MKKVFKSRIFIVIITLMIGVSGTLYATTKYQASEVLYNASNGDSITVKKALDDLYKDLNKCTSTSNFRVGDYVSMTPTSTSYEISKDLTGYTKRQTINPSELNLWRIIKINEDGTIEMISEYVSSTTVYFKGKTGYLNLVGVLNEIARQYGNSSYTIKARIMGYNGQTEYITDTSKFSSTAPLKSSTSDNSKEILGGGDIGYETDTNLVTEILGTLVANNPSGTATSYWLGSRRYGYNSSSLYIWYPRYVSNDGSVRAGSLLYQYSSGSWYSESLNRAIRPIVTLKSDVYVTGSGTRVDPWVLE